MSKFFNQPLAIYIMKKLLLSLLVAMGVAAGAQAQEVYVSYGAYTQMDATNCHKGFAKTDNAWGSLNIGLYIPVTKNLKIGPSYSYSSQFTPAKEYEFPYLGTYNLKSKVGYHTIMLNAKYTYYRSSIFNLYGHVGVGGVIANMRPKEGEIFNKGYFAGQISPIAAEVEFYPGAKFFGELGFGAQGLVQVGFSYSF